MQMRMINKRLGTATKANGIWARRKGCLSANDFESMASPCRVKLLPHQWRRLAAESMAQQLALGVGLALVAKSNPTPSILCKLNTVLTYAPGELDTNGAPGGARRRRPGRLRGGEVTVGADAEAAIRRRPGCQLVYRVLQRRPAATQNYTEGACLTRQIKKFPNDVSDVS